MTAATVRWIHSSHALESPSGGITWPWHSGQSGQPMPEPVTRTMTPIVTSRIVAPNVARDVFWKRVTARGGTSGRASRGQGRAPGTHSTHEAPMAIRGGPGVAGPLRLRPPHVPIPHPAAPAVRARRGPRGRRMRSDEPGHGEAVDR